MDLAQQFNRRADGSTVTSQKCNDPAAHRVSISISQDPRSGVLPITYIVLAKVRRGVDVERSARFGSRRWRLEPRLQWRVRRLPARKTMRSK